MQRTYTDYNMLIKGAQVIDLPIISSKDNKKLGNVKDIIYDPKQNKVIAFLVTLGDVLTEPEVLSFKEVKNLSKEAIVVKSSQSVKSESQVVKPYSTPNGTDTYMKNEDIVTNQGKTIGREQDIIFDTKTGSVRQFEVVSNSQTKDIKVDKVIASDKSKTVIKEDTTDKNDKKNDQESIVEKVKQFMSK